MFQQHRGGGNGAQRIRDAFPSDVGSGAVHGLEKPDLAADTRGRQQAKASGEHGCFIAQDVAEDVVRHNDVKLRRLGNQLHGGVVHIHAVEGDVGKLLRDFRTGLPP